MKTHANLELLSRDELNNSGIRDEDCSLLSFDYIEWEGGYRDDLPLPPDKYRWTDSGKWGANAKISQGIKNSRMGKRKVNNWIFFKKNVFPLLKLNPQEILHVANCSANEEDKQEILINGGWVKTEFNNLAYWTHPESTPVKHAILNALANNLPVHSSLIKHPPGYILHKGIFYPEQRTA